MGHIHVFDGAVDGRWARMLVGREIWYGARGLKKVSFLMESAGRAAVSLSGRVITVQSAAAAYHHRNQFQISFSRRITATVLGSSIIS